VRTLGRGTSPSWSPDSRRLAFASRYGVGTVSVTGSDRRIVAAAHASSVDWSLDGTMLVASVGVEHATGLVVMRPDGSDAHALPIGGFDPAWSPDSRRIAYSDGFALWVADADGTDARELTRLDDDPSDDINADRYPAWSPDGSLVLYSHGLELWDALDTGVHGDDAVEPEPFSLSTVDVATGESTAIFYRGDGHVRADAEYEASWAR
jgi:Tol biopolymer transport system component